MTRLTGWVPALLVAFTFWAPTWSDAAEDDPGFTLKDAPGEHLDVLHRGRVAARYVYAHDTSTPARTHDTYKPYLHVFDADGERPITKGAGGEFTHHRGIFIGWNKLGHAGKTYDRWHMQTGAIVHQRFANQQAGAGDASFTSVTHWNDDEGKPLLVEERTLAFAPAPAPARLVIDFASKLTNARDEEITLDGDPEHAGIHYRPADELVRADTVYVYAKENAKPHEDVNYPWVGQTHTLGGDHGGKRYSVVQMSHPDNPKNTRWSAYRNYGRFGAFPVATVKPGEPLLLRYRFLIADGEMPAPEFIQKSWDAFAGVKEASPVPKVTVMPAEQPKADAGAPGGKPVAAAMTKPTTRPKAGHPTNPGPEDAPILFDVPTPDPLTVEQALETFKIQGDFRIEPVAFEPMAEDPVAISFDERGRMYVVEMRGYMHDVEAKGEDQPIGRIRLLEDVDGDGRMDKASVFLDRLVMPRAVLAVRGGALVAEPPELAFWEDTDEDGTADRKTLVATDYGKRGGQPEHMANTPTLAMDNWVYSAGHYARFRFGRGKWAGEFTRSRGQWGLSQDDYGRLFYCYNSDLGRADLLPAQYAGRNPYHPGASFYNAQVVTQQDVWPSHPTPGVNRGYEKGQLREDGTLRTATAAGGNAIYRGGLFPPEFAGNLFVPEPSGNLVKRLVLSEGRGNITASNAYDGVDFLTSTDERFRPVQVTTGPDGALYLVDMYRGVLQHHGFLTHYLIRNIKQRDLETPIHMGRIYRIVPAGARPQRVTLPREGPELLEYLGHPNGWVRDTAQRLLVEINDRGTTSPLRKLVRDGPSSLVRLHALWALEGMGRLDAPTTLKALADADARVRAAAVRLCDPLLVPGPFRDDALRALLKLVPADESPEVRLQLALTLSAVPVPPAQEALGDLLTHPDGTAPELMRDAALSGLRGRELEFAGSLLERPDWSDHHSERAATLTALARCVMAERRPPRVRALLDLVADEPSGAWRQVALLEGMSPALHPSATDDERKQAAARVKLVYLDGQPESLRALLGGTDTAVRALAERLDARLAWPGKPGVPPPPKVAPLTADQQARFERGREVFANTCAACHQPGGQGLEGLAPPLVDSEWVTGPPARLARIVLHGLTGPITVNGAQYNLEMPALPTLSDAEVADVLTYVRRDWDHAADPVDEATVRAVREQTNGRVALWTARELLQVK
jgi:mono/diheme cytochrome c family protein/glucose/arabinose dehydrogenase